MRLKTWIRAGWLVILSGMTVAGSVDRPSKDIVTLAASARQGSPGSSRRWQLDNRGSRSPHGQRPGTGTEILPVSIGSSPACPSTHGTGLNDGRYPDELQVTAYGTSCVGWGNQPILWSTASGTIDLAPPPPATGGMAKAVSDGGLVVGHSRGGANDAFVRPPGGPAVTLPVLPGTMYAMAESISPNGQYIIGLNSTDTTQDLVRWTLVNGAWDVEPFGSGYPVGVDDHGRVVSNLGWDFSAQAVLQAERRARILRLPGTATVAHDISRSGDVVVGFYWQACPDPCGAYEVPVMWVRGTQGWTLHVLPALDGVDSEATGLAEVNGRTVIVGYGYTKKDAIMRAVAWLPQADGTYTLPIRLEALNGRTTAWASAEDVNSNGQVVGSSAGNGWDAFGVIWTLP